MLTKKQKNLLLFINKKLRSSGVSPSYEEMKQSLNLKSKSGIHRLISALEERGFIKRLAHKARALEVIKLPETASANDIYNSFSPSVIKGGLDEVNINSDEMEVPVLGKIAAGTHAINTEIHFSGVASPTASGFTFTSLSATTLPAVTFVVYHTRGTTVPIPGDGDYVPVFSKTVPTNSGFVDCSDVMPELATPVPQQGNTAGLGPKTPLKNRGIYLQRGDRLYVGVLQRGVYNTASGYIPGAHIVAQGGYY